MYRTLKFIVKKLPLLFISKYYLILYFVALGNPQLKLFEINVLSNNQSQIFIVFVFVLYISLSLAEARTMSRSTTGPMPAPPHFATAVDAILKNWTALQVNFFTAPKLKLQWGSECRPSGYRKHLNTKLF